jgi:hypothetical protein
VSRSFNGTTSQWLQHDAAVRGARPISIACWFKANNSTTATGLLMSISTSTDFNGAPYFGMRITRSNEGDPRKVRAILATTSFVGFNTTGQWTAGTWHLAVVVSNGASDHRVYLDTSKATSTANAGATLSGINRTSIAGQVASGGNTGGGLDGLVAHAAVWSVALSDSDVATLAGGAVPSTVQAGSCLAYWPLTGDQSPEPSSIGSFDMTLNGSPGFSTDNPPVGASVSIPAIYYAVNRR